MYHRQCSWPIYGEVKQHLFYFSIFGGINIHSQAILVWTRVINSWMIAIPWGLDSRWLARSTRNSARLVSLGLKAMVSCSWWLLMVWFVTFLFCSSLYNKHNHSKKKENHLCRVILTQNFYNKYTNPIISLKFMEIRRPPVISAVKRQLRVRVGTWVLGAF